MSLRYFVHVSSVSNLSDARYCSGMMVDSLGYNLDENSESRISYKTANEISKWVNGVKFVAEFNNSSNEYINYVLNNSFFDAIEIDFKKSISDLKFDPQNIIIKISDPNSIDHKINNYIKSNFPLTQTIIVDNISSSNINKLEAIDKRFMIIVNPFNKLENMLKILDKYKYGILLKGSNEIRPGFKDYDTISDILESIEDLS